MQRPKTLTISREFTPMILHLAGDTTGNSTTFPKQSSQTYSKGYRFLQALATETLFKSVSIDTDQPPVFAICNVTGLYALCFVLKVKY